MLNASVPILKWKITVTPISEYGRTLEVHDSCVSSHSAGAVLPAGSEMGCNSQISLLVCYSSVRHCPAIKTWLKMYRKLREMGEGVSYKVGGINGLVKTAQILKPDKPGLRSQTHH